MIILKSGREVYANHEILGIDPELNVYEGYDRSVCDASGLINDEERLTTDELCEIADIAIERWQRLKATRSQPEPSANE